MKQKMIEEIENRKVRIAICYDFDKTLSPDDMQTFTLIPSLGMDKGEFWSMSNSLAEENLMDKNLAWMYELINLSKVKRQPIKKEYFNDIGREIPLYKGVEGWFDRINKYAIGKGIEVEHYVISSGLKEIIEGSKIACKLKRVYASSYLYSVDGIAEWPAQAVNYTNKTQYIFRIAKGIFDEFNEDVNKSMSDEQLYIPYENIIYIGDSETDIPCMRLVKSKGGYSVGVYDPKIKNKDRVYQLYSDKRISFFTAADYSARSELSLYLKMVIDEIYAKERIKKEQKILKVDSDIYTISKQYETILKLGEREMSKKQKAEIQEQIQSLRGLLEE